MGQAIGQVLSYAVGVAISPLPIIAVDPDARDAEGAGQCPAFLAGWILGLAVVGTVVLASPALPMRTTTGSPRPGSIG